MAEWMLIIGALAGGVIVGALASRVVLSVLTKQRQPAPVRKSANLLANLVFWALVAVGLVVALGVIDPEALNKLPQDFVALLPNLLVAAIIIIGANILSSFVEAAVAPSLGKLPVETAIKVNRVIKAVIVILAVLIAVRQVGVDTTVVNLALAAIFFAIAGSFTLLVGFGGRAVAGEVASTRAVRKLISEGDHVELGTISGVVVAIHPTTVEVSSDTGTIELVPASKFAHETVSILRGS